MSCVRTHFNANLQEILKELNNRSLEELSNTKGIGKSKATSLVQYRDNFGPFQSIEDLFLIKGFGSAFFNNLQEAGELAAVKKKTSKGLETIRELLIRNKKEVGTICISIYRRPVSSVGRVSDYRAGGLRFEPQTRPTLRVLK